MWMERGCPEARLLRVGRCGVVVWCGLRLVLCGLRLLLVYFIHRDCIARIVALRGTRIGSAGCATFRPGLIKGHAHRSKGLLCGVHR